MTVGSPVAVLVHCAGMRMRLGFCRVNVGRDRRLIQALRIGAERHRCVRREDAKHVDDGKRQRRRETASPDRFEYRRHAKVCALRQIASPGGYKVGPRLPTPDQALSHFWKISVATQPALA